MDRLHELIHRDDVRDTCMIRYTCRNDYSRYDAQDIREHKSLHIVRSRTAQCDSSQFRSVLLLETCVAHAIVVPKQLRIIRQLEHLPDEWGEKRLPSFRPPGAPLGGIIVLVEVDYTDILGVLIRDRAKTQATRPIHWTSGTVCEIVHMVVEHGNGYSGAPREVLIGGSQVFPFFFRSELELEEAVYEVLQWTSWVDTEAIGEKMTTVVRASFPEQSPELSASCIYDVNGIMIHPQVKCYESECYSVGELQHCWGEKVE
ncbi:hypothetical protein BD413DRAFT_570175 [Trametes elegans]|nr:hypothetical protein BD413DRAFT_570175 [Trametes elegans]